MARATTKKDLHQDSAANFDKLFALIDSMTIEQQEKTFSFEDRDQNIRDVLVHLWEWHQLLLRWIRSNVAGEKANFLPEPYNWKTYPKMNIEFWEKHQKTPYGEAITLLKESHTEVMKLVDIFSNEQLFEKKIFPWTGTTTLGSYCVSATTSHYEWAMKKIKTHKKSLQ